MSEEIINDTEVMDNPVATDDDWSDVDLSDVKPDADGSDEDAPDDTEPSDKGADQPEPPPVTEPKAPDTITVTLNGKPETLSIKDAEQLIGRGQAWKELAKERDALAAKVKDAEVASNYLSELAKASGLSVAEFVRQSKIQSYINTGMDEASAKAAVARDEAVAKDRADAEAYRAQIKAQADAEAKMQQDIADFARAYPDLNPKDIPQSVWADVQAGMSPVSAWVKHENAALKAELAQLKQKKVNADVSTGSVASIGNKPKKDPFLEGFDG